MLIKKIIEKLEENSCEAEVQDALRAIQLKPKLATDSNGSLSSDRNRVGEDEIIFWEMIDRIGKRN